jgi:putative copper export protein
MLGLDIESLRIFLHVLAATIWVGGQLTLAALVPVLRSGDPDLPRRAAQQFSTVAWSAFAVLVLTGFWNIQATRDEATGEYDTVLAAKLAVVTASGLTAWLHAQAKSRAGLAVFGALTAITAIGALFLGVLLGSH